MANFNEINKKDLLKLWQVCQKHGSGNLDWDKMLRDGVIGKDQMNSLIESLNKKSYDQLEQKIGAWIKDFKFTEAFKETGGREPAVQPIEPIKAKSVDDIDQKIADLKKALEERAKAEAEKLRPKVGSFKVSGGDYIKPGIFDEVAH